MLNPNLKQYFASDPNIKSISANFRNFTSGKCQALLNNRVPMTTNQVADEQNFKSLNALYIEPNSLKVSLFFCKPF